MCFSSKYKDVLHTRQFCVFVMSHSWQKDEKQGSIGTTGGKVEIVLVIRHESGVTRA